MTTACIMQPTYLPWMGYFDLIDQADVFVFDDLAGYSTKSWHSRNRVRSSGGGTVWLSVPVRGGQGQQLNMVEIAAEGWRRKHLFTLDHAYAHAPHWPELRGTLALFYEQPWQHLTELTVDLTRELALLLGIDTTLVRASSLSRLRHGRLPRLADMLQSVDADVMLDTAGARDVLGVDEIEGVPIRWHEYLHPVYRQGGAEFVSHLSVVDVLAWHGPDALEIIRGGNHAGYQQRQSVA